MRFENAGITKQQRKSIEETAQELYKNGNLNDIALYMATASYFLELSNRQSALMDKLEVIESKINKIIKDWYYDYDRYETWKT